MSDDIIQIRDLAKIARRNLPSSAVIVAACVSLAVVAAFVVPKKFKTTAVLNIHASYFQIPLVSEMFSGTSDPSELRSQRESLLRMSLSDEFIDSLAEKHGVYESKPGDRLRVAEREAFLKSIQYFSTGSTSYSISANGRSAEQALEITRAVLDRMTSTLISERLGKLTRTRDAIQANLNDLRITLSSGGGADAATLGLMHEELGKAEGDLAALESRFTPQHPTVLAQRRKVEGLRARLSASGNRKDGHQADEAVSAGSRRALQDMSDELVRKLNYLNVVLEMEKDSENPSYLAVLQRPSLPASPYFPKKRAFLLAGIGAGLFLALVFALFRELKRGTFLTPVRAAQQLEVPFLGTLPRWNTAEAKLLIETSTTPSPTRRISVHESEKG